MNNEQKTFIAIDLKSFYASVECTARGLDPLTTNLVVADPSRTEKTICLAVSPSLKACKIPGRARLFEVAAKVREANAKRMQALGGKAFTGSSIFAPELEQDPSLSLDYLVAPPRMKLYMEKSAQIYQIYLNYVAQEDIHVYSIDEVLMDVTSYLSFFKLTAEELAMKMILDVYNTTGITATAGIGTNLYLCKVAMDIVAKHAEPDENGVRIAVLDELSYRKLLWDHRPLTDFWRVGRGTAKKLEANGLFTMGDICRCSVGKPDEFHNEELLYSLFGVNAELLIDHAWGFESCQMADIKAYRPDSNSFTSAQVLPCPYPVKEARIVLHEMADAMASSLVSKRLTTDQVTVDLFYEADSEGLYKGPVTTDFYGRTVPKPAHGSERLSFSTSSTREIVTACLSVYDRIVNSDLLIRKLSVSVNHVLPEEDVISLGAEPFGQLDLFTDYAALERERKAKQEQLQKERKLQETMLDVKKKFGKNALLKGTNLQKGATAMERNRQIGGHKA